MDRYFDALGIGYLILFGIIPELLAKKAFKSLFDWTVFAIYLLFLSLVFTLWYFARPSEDLVYINLIFGPAVLLVFIIVFLKSRK